MNRREKLVSFRRRSGSRDDVVDSNQAATCGRRPPTVGPRAAAARNQTRVNVIQLRRGWHGDAIVDRRTCDHQVASSISGQGAAAWWRRAGKLFTPIHLDTDSLRESLNRVPLRITAWVARPAGAETVTWRSTDRLVVQVVVSTRVDA